MAIPIASAVPRGAQPASPDRRPDGEDEPAGGERAHEQPGRRPLDLRVLGERDHEARDSAAAEDGEREADEDNAERESFLPARPGGRAAA